MKKKWKWVLGLFLVIILGGAGTVYYFLNMKDYDVADEQIDELTETEYKVDIPALEEIETEEPVSENQDQEEGSAVQTEASGDQGTSNTKDEVQSSASNQNTNGSSAKAAASSGSKVTVAVIKKRYRAAFEQLESQANQRVDSLIARAVNEYSEKKSNGEEISFSYFYVKYSNAGKSLEAMTDSTFNSVYGQLEKDLQAHGYSTAHAKEYRDAYDQMKEQRRSAIMNKIKGAI